MNNLAAYTDDVMLQQKTFAACQMCATLGWSRAASAESTKVSAKVFLSVKGSGKDPQACIQQARLGNKSNEYLRSQHSFQFNNK